MDKNKLVLVTGGAGYIGSHCVTCLYKAGYKVVVFDNFSNSSPEVLDRVAKIVGEKVELFEGDLRDKKAISEVFKKYNIGSVIHFAGLKAVNESLSMPLEYYDNNIAGTINLLFAMKENNVNNLVFSSTAAVYGIQEIMPIRETAETKITTPYGNSKLFIEHILLDFAKAAKNMNIGILRYFNPVGGHESGIIGERPSGIPNNLMPYITQTAHGIREKLYVFGNDYPTPDGSGMRDFIHVMDLSESHVEVLKFLVSNGGIRLYNVGTGKGTTVFQLIEAYQRVNNVKIPHEIVARREGDPAMSYADASKINTEVGWKAKRGIDQMVADAYRFV